MHAKGSILVAFSKAITEEQAEAYLQGHGLRLGKYMPAIQVASVAVPEGTEQEWVDKLSQDKTNVSGAQLNEIKHAY